jgi:two-component system, cell cycle sensor histidine kinase and response regulator CckA
MRILSIDDKDENRYFVEVLLGGSGYQVVSATNGAEALDYLGESTYDLILSDILMPVMDGFELCRKVKSDPRLQNIPLIFYTATYTGPQDEAFAKKVGADAFIVKPCEPEILIATIRQVLAEVAEKQPSVPSPLPIDEEEIFKLYNERLVRKLEQKMLQLEQETKALREAEAALRISEGKYRRLHESMTDGFALVDMAGNILESNLAYEQMLGYTKKELQLLTYMDLTPAKWHGFERGIVKEQVLTNDTSEVYEKEYRDKQGRVFPVELKTFLVRNDQGQPEAMWAIVRDLTERKKAEKSRLELEGQLRQAQKMESIGRLAGGVAHDYNNMLSVILGYAELSLTKTTPGSVLYDNLSEILDAARRSAGITRQLLAFARKQTVEPQVLDLNVIVEGMLKILQRLIGEDLQLLWQPGIDLWSVLIDPSQVDQILANLCINSRDAISQGGTIRIETENRILDQEICHHHAGWCPGDYVRLSVSDTGYGMDAETMDKIFEPFFTTKKLGQGTGLGLATVYGIVKQNHGMIDVESEPGRGTTFTIYLPRHWADEKKTVKKEERLPHGKGETILVVEDEAAILRLATHILSEAGYRVFTAATPSQALQIASGITGPLHLLLTDVIMPEMNGHQLEQLLRTLRPHIKSLFMSGYTAGYIGERGILADGVNFLQKPFSAESLIVKVRQLLSPAH